MSEEAGGAGAIYCCMILAKIFLGFRAYIIFAFLAPPLSFAIGVDCSLWYFDTAGMITSMIFATLNILSHIVWKSRQMQKIGTFVFCMAKLTYNSSYKSSYKSTYNSSMRSYKSTYNSSKATYNSTYNSSKATYKSTFNSSMATFKSIHT